jgi:hypothetical protein
MLFTEDTMALVGNNEFIVGGDGKDIQHVFPVSMSDTVLGIKLYIS